jgi:hypothetical protein
MVWIVEIDVERIVEDGLCLRERDAVLGEVGRGFIFVPLEFHNN